MGALKGKVAVVTGSTSGIGLGIANALAEAGADIVFNGRKADAEQLALVESAGKKFGVRTTFVAADMGQPDQIYGLIEKSTAEFGSVDILVNNAGIQHVTPVHEFPVDKWDQIIAVNLSSVFHATKAALPGMKAKGYGRIINVSSVHGLIASPFKSAYVAAKHGVIGFTKVVALECAREGITSNAICPGYVWTPLVEKQIDDQAKAHNLPRDRVITEVLLKEQPNREFATVEQMGALAVYLSSDAASTLTGVAIPVDGGWVAH
ncbi:3-hydroxybutyrate dehydrogenase [Zavarzinia sp. CC-PAN008]|uniref:3-hydroxybutyrate dehydrogenase n=1 Tax=Zavarzinia sp. CC-PAN008 TaxID=3243332 RepID=UPI003F746C22